MNKYNPEFTVNELCNWINNKLPFGEEYKNNLEMNHIDGASFLRLNLPKLKDIGILTVGHRLAFYKLVLKKKQKHLMM